MRRVRESLHHARVESEGLLPTSGGVNTHVSCWRWLQFGVGVNARLQLGSSDPGRGGAVGRLQFELGGGGALGNHMSF